MGLDLHFDTKNQSGQHLQVRVRVEGEQKKSTQMVLSLEAIS